MPREHSWATTIDCVTLPRVLRYAALLRAISNVEMAPLRRRLESLGFAEVESYGMSGNFFFTTERSTRAALEKQIAGELGTHAFVRTQAELAAAADGHPFRGQKGAAVMFLARRPRPSMHAALTALDVTPPAPELRGDVLYFVHPTTIRGRRTPLDFEEILDRAGTARSLSVVDALAGRFAHSPIR